jgi:hypothetical protein
VILIDRQWGVDNLLKTTKNTVREVTEVPATVETAITAECTVTANAVRRFEAEEVEGVTFVSRCWHCSANDPCTATR